MEARISNVVNKNMVNLFKERPLGETNSKPEKNDIEQTGNTVKNLQSVDIYSPKGELSTEKVAKSQEKDFDQYF